MARHNPYAELNWRKRDLSSPLFPKRGGGRTHKVKYGSIYDDKGNFLSRGLATKGPGKGKPRKGKSEAGRAKAKQWHKEVMAIYRSQGGSLKDAMFSAQRARQNGSALIPMGALAFTNPLSDLTESPYLLPALAVVGGLAAYWYWTKA